jgi:hypothetical protein
MKIKILIIIGLFVALTGCMGVVAEKDVTPETRSIIDHEEKKVANVENFDTFENKRLTNERRVARMMAWVDISRD